MTMLTKPDYSHTFWEELYIPYLERYKNHDNALPKLIADHNTLWNLGKIPSLDGLKEIYLVTQSASNLTQGLLYRFMYEYVELTPENTKILKRWYNGAKDGVLIEAILCTDKLNKLCNSTFILDDKCVNILLSTHPCLYYELLDISMDNYNNNLDDYRNDELFQLMFKQCFIEWMPLESLISSKHRPDRGHYKSGLVVDLSCLNTINVLCKLHVNNWLENIKKLCTTKKDLYKFYLGWHTLGTSQVMTKYLTQFSISPQNIEKLVNVFKYVDATLKTEFKTESLTSSLLQNLFEIDDFDLYQQKREILNMPIIEPCEYPTL